MCNILRALYRGSVARPRRWCSSCPVRLRHSLRASPARYTTWNGSMTALAPRSSSVAAYLNPVNPSIATISMRSRHVSDWETSQVLKTRLERPGTISRSREGPQRSRIGVTSKMTVTYLSPYGVCRHTCSSTPMTRTPSHRAGSLISRRTPSAKTAVFAALPGHAKGLGDARHRQMVDHQPSERPAHRRTRELGTRIGRLTHVLMPRLSTLLALLAAHTHKRDCGAQHVGLVRLTLPYSVGTTNHHQ